MVARRIFVIQTDTAGCFWYRLKTPLEALDPDRFQVVWAPPGAADLSPGDIVIGQRIAGDNAAWLDICSTPGVLAVYDLDDDLLNIDPTNTVPYQIYAPQVEGTRLNIAAAGLVTVSSMALFDMVSRINPSVALLANCLPDAWLSPRPELDRPLGAEIWVGWAGSMFHQQDWTRDVLAGLQQLKEADPRIRYHMIGANYIGGLADRVSPWSTMDALHAALDFDLGIAPLEPTPFNGRKSWVKALEYAGRGIPVVGSFVGQYVDWCEQSPDGNTIPGLLLHHDSPRTWFDALTHAISSERHPTLREMGAAAYELAQFWTISRQIHNWTEAYER